MSQCQIFRPEEIASVRRAGSILKACLEMLAKEVKPGITTVELDKLAEDFIRHHGGEPAFKGYHTFPATLCTSVNDAVLHGLPHNYRLRDGDLLSLDFAASVDGWVADSAVSVVVGSARQDDLDLIDTTVRALDAGIAAATVGNRLGDVSAAIGAVAHADGLSVNLQFGGHGVGRTMHGDPHVSNDGRPGRGLVLKPGLVIAIEPWFLRGTDKIVTDEDGWTLRSADGSRGAHSEHTIAVTAEGPLILTAR